VPLVAVAHGSVDLRAAAAVTELMGVVRARAARVGLGGLQVRAAYLGHALPSVPDVLEALSEPESESITAAAGPGPSGRPGRPPEPARGERPVIVLPLLLTGAYHSDTDLPAVLSEAASRLPRLRIGYGDPLGPHPSLVGALQRRLAEAGTTGPPGAAPRAATDTSVGDTAVVLAAAGSSRPAANAAVAQVAAALQSACGWRAVVPAFASAASPTPAQAVTALLRAGAPRVLVATYLLAPGRFADQVRESSLAAGAAAVSAPLGAAPEVADVIIERYLQAIAATARPASRPARALSPSLS
jgi:sirohydrochlorin ferrochelatase